MYINCVKKSRYYVKKGKKRVGWRDIYIINLITRLIGIYYILLTADPQRAYSRLVRTGEELETITDSDIEVLVGTQDMGTKSFI